MAMITRLPLTSGRPGSLGRRARVVAAALCCLLYGGIANSSEASWSRTEIVGEPTSCAYDTPALDARGGRWVACELYGGAHGLFVGRVTPRHGLTAAQLVPGTVGFRIIGPALGIDPHGTAVLAWGFANPQASWWDAPSGTAAVMWRLGHPVGSPSVVSPMTTTNTLAPSVAINPRGIAIVLFNDQQGVHAARLRADQVLGVEPLAIAGERAMQEEIFATRSAGFLVSWLIGPGEEQPSALHQVTVDGARAGSEGVFSVEPPTTIPLLITPSPEPPYDSAWSLELHSDIRGNQILTWGASGPAGRTDYVVSRSAGHAFTAPQPVGKPPAVSSVQSVVGPAGRFTVLWTGAHTIEATAGVVGGPLSAPHTLGTHGFDDMAVLPDGTTIGVWVHRTEQLSEAGPIEAATSRDGRRFSRPHVLSRMTARIHACSDPRLQVDGQHTAIAEWICQVERGHGGATEVVAELSSYTSALQAAPAVRAALQPAAAAR